jgi:glycosyltransferase involved in cell wall biosynthesis
MYESFKEALTGKVDVVDKASVVVDMMQPHMVKGWWDGQYRVLFTMWETDELPRSMWELFPQYDKILVPCKHNVELFSKYHDNVAMVPLGVDINLWSKRPKKPGKKPFRFLAGGSHWKRKGLDIVLAAFDRITGDVELHLKCKDDIIGGVPPIRNPKVFVHNQVMTPEEERDFYWSMNCYLAISRGEGWGLMPHQAIHAGLPTIISDTSGHKEFAQYAHAVIPTTAVPSQENMLYNIGNWDEADLDTLVQEMQTIVDQWSKVPVPEPTPYTWDYAADQLLAAIPTGKTLTTKIWIQSNETLVPVQALRKIDSHIGQHHITLAKGEVADIPLNAKTVLLENGAIIPL